MPITPQEPDDSASDNKPSYRTSLVQRSHEILKMGYGRLDAASLAASEEEVVTGRLTKAMQEALEDWDAPLWAKNFGVQEEVPVNDGQREGKRRLQIDIEVIEHRHGPRPRFRFEAKRLRGADSHQTYLGKEGLGRFLDGRYAASDPDAGMLGYVQEGTEEKHGATISAALLSDPARFRVAQDGGWKEYHHVKALKIYTSSHHRTGGSSGIVIFHTLLNCHLP